MRPNLRFEQSSSGVVDHQQLREFSGNKRLAGLMGGWAEVTSSIKFEGQRAVSAREPLIQVSEKAS
jgi:hypothetical protein